MKMLTTALLAAATLAALPVSAQGVDERRANQDARIDQGVASGELTRGETRGLDRQQRSIHREEHAFRAADGGRLTAHDRRVLEHRENRASNRIYRLKHNGRVR